MSAEREGSAQDAGSLRMDSGIFVLSAAVLTLEVLQTRIFAFSLDPLTVYLAIGVCLLGLGTSATLLSLVPGLGRGNARSLSAIWATAAAVAIPVSHALFARLGTGFWIGRASSLTSLLALIALAVPYLCLGMGTTLLLVARAASIGRAYAFNLAGSGLGCLLVFPLLDLLGAESLLVVVAAMALLAALILAPAGRPALRTSFAVVAVVLAAAQLGSKALFAFQPYPPLPFPTEQLFSRWDRTGRVDVYRLVGKDQGSRYDGGGWLKTLFWTQDGGAGSMLFDMAEEPRSFEPFFRRTVYGAGYVLGAVDDVLIIGLGGAPDVLNALFHSAKRISVAEINGTAIDVVRDEFGEYLGNPAARPEVTLSRADGRAFVRGSDDSFDLIQMSGVDTKSFIGSGAYPASAMNYLYTREAMREYLRRLRPDGVLAVIRPAGFEASRLVSTAMAGLRDEGVDAPERHLMVIRQGIWAVTLVKRSPFTAKELDELHGWVERMGSRAPRVAIRSFDEIGITLSKPMEILYSPAPRQVARTPIFRALAAGRLDSFVAKAGDDYSPPDDDRPFFFFRGRLDAALSAPPPVLRSLYASIAQFAGVSAAFILAPLVYFRGRGLRAPRAGRSLVYFTCLGAGFMLVEIGLMQRFVLLLGHQSYAITVVLFGLLMGASAGSFLSSRIPPTSRRTLMAAIGVLILVTCGYAFGLPSVFDLATHASFGARLGLALALLIFLGAWLGIPFPTALRALEQSSPPLVAWGIGVNGFASVVGATVAVPLAMLSGLRVVLLVGVLLYALAAVTAPLGPPERELASAD